MSAILGKSVSLPVIGAVSLPVAIGVGALIYFAFFRKKGRVTSVLTRYSK